MAAAAKKKKLSPSRALVKGISAVIATECAVMGAERAVRDAQALYQFITPQTVEEIHGLYKTTKIVQAGKVLSETKKLRWFKGVL